MGVANNLKKGVKKAAKVAKLAIKNNPLMLKVKLIAIGVLLGLFILIYLACAAYIFIESASENIKKMFANAFPSSGQTEGTTSIVEAAKKIHSAIEGKYSYGNDNTSETLAESEAAGKTTIDCTTYVDWVLHEIGQNINSKSCPELKGELDSASFVKKIDSQTNAKAGDIVLFERHIQIYAGNERWKRFVV